MIRSVLSSALGMPNFVAEREVDPSLDAEDERTKMTQRQKNVVREIWVYVMKRHATKKGPDFLVRFITKYPQYQEYFKKFADVPLDKLPDDPNLDAHEKYVMATIASITESLDDFESMQAKIQKLARTHKAHNVKPEYYKDLTDFMVEFLVHKFGSALTPFGHEAWLAFFVYFNYESAKILSPNDQ